MNEITGKNILDYNNTPQNTLNAIMPSPKESEEESLKIVEMIDAKSKQIYDAASSLFIPNKQSIKTKDIEAVTQIVSRLINKELIGVSVYIWSKLPKNTSIIPLSDYIELAKEYLLEQRESGVELLIEEMWKKYLLETK